MSDAEHIPITINEAAALSGFSVRTIYTYALDGRFPVHKPTGGKLIFFKDEIVEHLSRGKKKTSWELADEATHLLSTSSTRKRQKA